jgi:hypothetical protein
MMRAVAAETTQVIFRRLLTTAMLHRRGHWTGWISISLVLNGPGCAFEGFP